MVKQESVGCFRLKDHGIQELINNVDSCESTCYGYKYSGPSDDNKKCLCSNDFSEALFHEKRSSCECYKKCEIKKHVKDVKKWISKHDFCDNKAKMYKNYCNNYQILVHVL